MCREFAKALRTGKPGLLTTAEAGMKVSDIAREATNEAIRKRVVNSKSVKTETAGFL